ncbi:MAG: protein-glutamate O-methyltransferase CheR [Lentisphaeria bacterium]|nr:protein-glutamate O-methyltransferase CheR [Lentisphaeria bacterium]
MIKYPDPIDDISYAHITKLVYRLSGIALGNSKKTLVTSRLSNRISELELGSFENYCRYIDAHGSEIQKLIDLISTNVTHFFREKEHFGIITSRLLALHKRGQRKFRLWSAASSTGEEPYSLMIEILEAFHQNSLIIGDLKILATDISTNVSAVCKKGIYEKEKLQNISRKIVAKYFTAIDSNNFRVKPELQEYISFKQVNLTNQPYPLKGPLDIIMCRNVMIYFDEATKANIVYEFERLMSSTGLLVIGQSESISGIQSHLKVFKPSVYQKQ